MKKLIIAILLALALTVVIAGPALAAIHPIVESMCAAQDSETGAGQHRNPPGQIENPSTESGGANEELDHPFQNSNPNATSGEGTANCENPRPAC